MQNLDTTKVLLAVIAIASSLAAASTSFLLVEQNRQTQANWSGELRAIYAKGYAEGVQSNRIGFADAYRSGQTACLSSQHQSK